MQKGTATPADAALAGRWSSRLSGPGHPARAQPITGALAGSGTVIGRTALSRRALLVAATTAPLAAACTTPPPEPLPPDPLAELVRTARADTALATALGATETAAARTQHADKLQAEVDRATPKVPGTSATQPQSTSTPPAPPANPTREALVTNLQTAQKQAADLAVTAPTHRAGLLASVSAGCAALVEALA
ncbi:hypothetical protein BN6_69860 [Saccharothrix espanaensis DSM 44229]|uniref:Uncharacterized protein n=1 Tax=Saccharothrix espanaensis (strain ATCC 51144 / DSM 44229 / JCM 9112 / NBRC 15066 / NRRL 15764) TaxID=1179773 RepID=K0K9L0_SACES|nr:hypothetical protein BN6_69860 [Saccharothrix espanaensis DSM 44229]